GAGHPGRRARQPALRGGGHRGRHRARPRSGLRAGRDGPQDVGGAQPRPGGAGGGPSGAGAGPVPAAASGHPGPGAAGQPGAAGDEVLAVAEDGVEEGVIAEDERALIESIIEFGDTIVREIMIPRPDMVTVPAHFRVADVMEVFLLNGYSRLPVCGEGLDDVV